MKIIPLEQGTQEWLSWRKTVITATDCPIINGSSPWNTPYRCWQRKLGLVEEQKTNEAMERGKRLEPEARAQFINQTGLNMTPVVVESSEFDFLGASLDGLSDNEEHILEIKCGGEKLHNMASQQMIPEYYLDQIQHQLLVTGAKSCFYYSYNGKEGICIEVLPDPAFVEKFMPKARAFWKCVAFSEPPSMQESDYKNMEESQDWKEYAKIYQELDATIKTLEDKKDGLRKKLIDLCSDQSCIGNGVKVIKTMMRGKIAYDEIPEIKHVDLDKYRKAPTPMWKVFVEAKI